jgi:hypothetical protein
MAPGRMGPFVQQLCRALTGAEAAGLSDRQLLDTFIASRDEAALSSFPNRSLGTRVVIPRTGRLFHALPLLISPLAKLRRSVVLGAMR